MAADLHLVRRLGAAEHGLVVIATVRPDGTVHTSVVNAGVTDDPFTGRSCVGLVVRADARKLAYLRASGRAAVVFRSSWEWATVEGPTRILGPDDPQPGFDPADLPALLRTV